MCLHKASESQHVVSDIIFNEYNTKAIKYLFNIHCDSLYLRQRQIYRFDMSSYAENTRDNVCPHDASKRNTV